MPITFLHFSDVHLGYQQYGDRERFNDFGRAFLKAVDVAIEEQVDFVLISGDLFHKSAIDPPTLLQAANGIEGLRNAGISVVAIAGNHDRAKYRDRFSWLDYLAERGYIALLSPSFEQAGIVLNPWDGHAGAYVDFGPVRVIALGRTRRRLCGFRTRARDRGSVSWFIHKNGGSGTARRVGRNPG
jgi:DNA repair exonuclease SbcCD nuclease subunit